MTFCINHQPASPATKTVRAFVYSATQPTAFPRKIKMAPTTLPTIARNASTAFPVSLLSASANLSKHFYKAPSSFGGKPPKTPVMARIIVDTVVEKAVSIDNMVMPCSLNKVRILSVNDVS